MREKRLIIKTDKYAGNFERELIGYCFGRLSEEQEQIEYAREYVRAFWRSYARCNDYESYLIKEEKQKKFEDLMKKTDSILGMTVTVEPKLTIQDIYENYLEFLQEEVDDDYEKTFYSSDDKEISIWFKQDLPEESLNMFIQRIRSFFNNNVFETFENAIHLTEFNSLCDCDNKIKLISLSYENKTKKWFNQLKNYPEKIF